MRRLQKILILVTAFLMVVSFYSCSKRSHPSKTETVNSVGDKNASATPKPVVAPKRKATFPKVISVNDSAASKSVDGRLYYDVMGHRYWRNYKDGKYYLFNKSMYNDPAFKNPG